MGQAVVPTQHRAGYEAEVQCNTPFELCRVTFSPQNWSVNSP